MDEAGADSREPGRVNAVIAHAMPWLLALVTASWLGLATVIVGARMAGAAEVTDSLVAASGYFAWATSFGYRSVRRFRGVGSSLGADALARALLLGGGAVLLVDEHWQGVWGASPVWVALVLCVVVVLSASWLAASLRVPA